MKLIKFSLFIFALLFLFSKTTMAATTADVVLVNPIRGNDFWNYNFSLTETPQKQYQLISQSNLPASWLARYDALIDPKIQEFLKSLNNNQDIGIFFEITPTLARDAGVNYNQSENWHLAKSVLLTGYSPEDRVKLIETVFEKYKEIFGFYPKSVGAWWIDAYSLGLMKENYGITANLDVADQYSTDGYQVWGQYWSTPFYPSKNNALMPAQSAEQKLGVVTMQWATRDPLNGYGNGVFESTYSVQANDYILHDLGIDYFEKLLNIYPQTTVGIENDFNFNEFGPEYTKQIELIANLKNSGKLKVFNMPQYASKYESENPEISPQVVIAAKDPLGGGGQVIWFMNPNYRAGLFFGPNGVIMRDLRFYNDSNKEDCFEKNCDQLKLAFSQTSAIDEGNFNSRWVIDESPATDISTSQTPEGLVINYKTQSGLEKSITFLPNDLKVNDRIYTIPVAVMEALQSQTNQSANEENFISDIDWNIILPSIFAGSVKFLFLILIFFLIPGLIFTKRIYLAIPLGIALFTLGSYLLGYLANILPIFKSPWWLLFLPVLSLVVKPKPFFSYLKNFRLPTLKQNYILLILLIFGSLTWSLTTIKNGLLFNYGYGFWGPNGHDAIWHLSLISQIQKGIPPQNPIFAGSFLNNYHYFYDLLIAASASIFNISAPNLLFRFFPLLLSILSGILIYKLTIKISKSKIASCWAVFFMYFGGSFGWIISYFRNGDFGGETMFWAQQSISTMLNPPFASSMVLLLAGLIFFYNLKEKFNKLEFFAAAIVFGVLIEFKAYAGVLLIASLFLVSLERLLKRDFRFFGLFLLSSFISALVFVPNNLSSSGLIELMPLWLINSMISSQDRLNWYRLTLTLQSGVLYKLIYGYGLGVLIFFLGNLGTRIIGAISIKEIFKERILTYILILSAILPLIFIQKGTAWNIVQFLYYGLFIMAIFAGIGVEKISRKLPKLAVFILSALIILLTIPTTISTLNQYLPSRPPAKLGLNEIKALEFLQTQEDGVVLSYPFEDKTRSLFSTPLPLAAYTSTAYIPAFSEKPGFIEDTINLDILGIDYKPRQNLAKEIFKTQSKSHELLTQNNIKYLYNFKPLKLSLDENLMGLETIYENEEVQIYKVIP